MSTPYVFRGTGYTLVHVGRGRYAVYLTGLSWGYCFQGGFRAARRYAASLVISGGH